MSEPYDHSRGQHEDGRDERPVDAETDASGESSLEEARENVFEGWPSSEDVGAYASGASVVEPPAATVVEPAPEPFASPPEPDPVLDTALGEEPEPEQEALDDAAEALSEEPEPVALVDLEAVSHEHAPGELEVPPGYGVLEGVPDGSRRAVGIVVSRFNG